MPQTLAGLTPLAARLVRAQGLEVTPIGIDEWRVIGATASYLVDAAGCSCPDYQVRKIGPCKHMIAVALFRADPELRQAIGELVKAVEQQVQANV